MLKNQDIFNVEAITVAPYSHKKSKVSIKEGQNLSYNEILKICKWLNFYTDNKVFKGSTDYIKNGYKEENDAVNQIIEIALKNDKTYILAIGAITNIALAIEKEPKIIDKIEVIWLGGHNLLQDKNDEFNFKQDIEADRILFNSKVNLTILPCRNVASNLRTSIYELEHYLKNKSELCNYLLERFYNDGYHGLQEGNKDRILYLDEACSEAISEYIKERPKLDKSYIDYNALFLSSRNKRISTRNVQTIIKDELKMAFNDTKNDIHTHSLRHTTASLMYNINNTDILILKRMLGHSSLSSTEIYTHVSSQKMKEIMNNCTISSILEKKKEELLNERK